MTAWIRSFHLHHTRPHAPCERGFPGASSTWPKIPYKRPLGEVPGLLRKRIIGVLGGNQGHVDDRSPALQFGIRCHVSATAQLRFDSKTVSRVAGAPNPHGSNARDRANCDFTVLPEDRRCRTRCWSQCFGLHNSCNHHDQFPGAVWQLARTKAI